MSTRIHKLPALSLFENGDDSCQVSADCPLALICVKNTPWQNDTNVAYVRFGDGENSDTLSSVPAPKGNFCSCDQNYGWTGADCTKFDGAAIFEIIWFLLAIFVHIFILVVGTKDLFELRLHAAAVTAVNKSLMILLIAAALGLLGACLHFDDSVRPKDSYIDPLLGFQRFRQNATAWTFTNCFTGMVTFVASFHVVYCWLQVTQNVQRLRKSTGQFRFDLMMKIIAFLEGSLFITIVALCAVNKPSDAFVATIPWILILIGTCLYGARSMTKLLSAQSFIVKQPAPQSGADIGNKKSGKKSEQFSSLLNAIRTCAWTMILFYIIGIIGGLTIFISQQSVILTAQSPEGNFNRPFMWGNNIVMFICFPGVQLTLLNYLHRLIRKRIEAEKSSNPNDKKTSSHRDDFSQSNNNNNNNNARGFGSSMLSVENRPQSPSTTQNTANETTLDASSIITLSMNEAKAAVNRSHSRAKSSKRDSPPALSMSMEEIIASTTIAPPPPPAEEHTVFAKDELDPVAALHAAQKPLMKKNKSWTLEV